MGWTHHIGATRKDIIADRTRDQENDSAKWTCIRHCCRGNTLWAVWSTTYKKGKWAGETHVYITCDLLAKSHDDYGWGYKDMSEEMHPYYYSCPLSYLDIATHGKCEAWREGVRKYHAKRNRKLEKYATYKLEGCMIPEIEINSTKPLIGSYNGRRYKLTKKLIGDIIRTAEQNRELVRKVSL